MTTESRELPELPEWCLDDERAEYVLAGMSGPQYRNDMEEYARAALAHSRAQDSGGEAVAWHTDDHLTDKSATTYDPAVAERWRAKGWPVTTLYAAAQQPAKGEWWRCACGDMSYPNETCAMCNQSAPQPSDPADAVCDCAATVDGGSHSRDCSAYATPPTAQRHDVPGKSLPTDEDGLPIYPAHGAGAAVEAVDAFGRTGPLLKGWDRLAREEDRPGHSRLTWAQAAADLRQSIAHSRSQDSGGEAVCHECRLSLTGMCHKCAAKMDREMYDDFAAQQPAKGEGELPRDVAKLLDSTAWTVHPDSMSHDEAGSLWVWAQDAAAALRKYATPQPSDPADAEWASVMTKCYASLARAVSAEGYVIEATGEEITIRKDATPPTAQRHDEGDESVWMFKNSLGGWSAFHSEKHRLDTIESGEWDVREFVPKTAAHGTNCQSAKADGGAVAPAAVEAVDAFGRTGPLLEGLDRLAREEDRPGHSRLTWAQAAADLRQVQMRNAALSTQPLLSDQPAGVSNGKEANDA